MLSEIEERIYILTYDWLSFGLRLPVTIGLTEKRETLEV